MVATAACAWSLPGNVSRLAAEHGSHFDSAALLNLSWRLAAGERARIVTLGGSVPYGNNCIRPDGAHHRDCSWPARLTHALREGFPTATITHDNLASGGNGVVHILSTLGIVLRERTDLILLDSLVNDAWRSGSTAASQALEALVRTARILAPSAALVVVEAAAPGLGDEVAREKRRVLEHYGVPTLDWHSAATRAPGALWFPGPIAGTDATDIVSGRHVNVNALPPDPRRMPWRPSDSLYGGSVLLSARRASASALAEPPVVANSPGDRRRSRPPLGKGCPPSLPPRRRRQPWARSLASVRAIGRSAYCAQ